MSVTYGFYNAKNHDRRYNSIQISSIFDGIISDGIYMSIGDHMVVKSNSGMMVTVGVGRAWFNHTWTLNDSLLPIEVPLSEIILNRIDAIVLEVNAEESVRENTIKVIKGTPATNPARPLMVNTSAVHQYPLAYIYVGSGVTEIRQSNITNMVGTSATPFVTGIIDTINIDDLIAQWGDQWEEYYAKQVADMERTNIFWKEQWATWFLAQTTEIQEAYLAWEKQWTDWFHSQTAEMESTNAFWKQQWEQWFYGYINGYTAEMADWRDQNQADFISWFQNLQAMLSSDVAANMAKEILDLQKRTKVLEVFSEVLSTEYAVYHQLYDSGYRTYGVVQDSSNKDILDSNIDAVIGRTHSSELILDSNGNPIDARVIFVTK